MRELVVEKGLCGLSMRRSSEEGDYASAIYLAVCLQDRRAGHANARRTKKLVRKVLETALDGNVRV